MISSIIKIFRRLFPYRHKVWCGWCKGEGIVQTVTHPNLRHYQVCADCKGKGYTWFKDYEFYE
jgi:DnaJ-class molecular chaperone